MTEAGKFDVVVVGAGHAGIEAALAAARLGVSAALFTLNLDAVGNMPCNPSIGGSAKGQLVREIDALGGEMAKAADATFLQSRMLNRGKGPAIHSPRVQSDRRAYQAYMKQVLEQTENLSLIQNEIIALTWEGDRVAGVVTRLGQWYGAGAVILASGTYLKGRIVIGDVGYDGGPDGMFPAGSLSESLEQMGIRLVRFKTGTPPRINRRSVDFSQMELQEGDDPVAPLSFEAEHPGENRAVCYLTYTTEETHRIIRENLHRSPLFGGMIKGVGPRYCPSIEDKVVRFAEKERHQLFIEPLGADTEELYIQGLSSSLPVDVQEKIVHSIPGLERAEIMRWAYAIEYDCCDPLQLDFTLAFKQWKNLYGAGQFNGTSGYEEAAAQGLLAGINAARQILGLTPVTLPRDSSYLGTLVDDLVTKGTNEPYRMMTSRSEYRLLLRQDNADERLTPLGHEIGLIGEERFARFTEKWQRIAGEEERLTRTVLPPTEALNAFLRERGSAELKTGVKLAELIRRPELSYDLLAPFDTERPALPPDVAEEAEIRIKYAGYIRRQQQEADENRRLESRRLPETIDYMLIRGLRIEAQQKLAAQRPATIGQASRIPGVNPADISVLLIWLEQHKGD